MMLRVLIVDDERWMRDTVERSIEWESKGFRVAGKAIDGVQAYEMIQTLKPDIVLADIRMPGMDGLDLLRLVRRNRLNPVFIFFSGYDRFEYAKEAVNLGAMGYILKPIDEKELIDMLLKAREHVEAQRYQNESEIKLTDLLEKERSSKKSECIQKMLKGYPVDTLILQNAGIDLVFDGYMVASFEMDFSGEAETINPPGKDTSLKIALSTLCTDFFESAGIRQFTVISPKGVHILLNLPFSNHKEDMEVVMGICKRISETFRSSMGYMISAGIGFVVPGLSRIPESYASADKALEYRLILGGGSVIDSREVYESPIRTIILDQAMEREIIKSFEKFDFTLPEKLAQHVEKLLKTTKLSIDDLRVLNYSLIELVYRLLNKAGVSTDSNCRNPNVLCNEMNCCRELGTLFEKHGTLIRESMRLISDRSLNYFKKLADDIRRYIHEHYREDISLEVVAQVFAFHPNYISRIFKEEFGETFIDYLTNYRIDTAKELLKNQGRQTVSEVAARVGYSDPKYFSKVFKKVTGLTPAEYCGKKQV